jgi:hypothetical protein
MPRLKSLPLAFGVLALSAAAAYGFATMPSAADPGLDKATEASGQILPARPAAPGPPAADVVTNEAHVPLADLPDAAGHGADVSSVAKSDDPTPDTNKGADVSAAAKDNAGQAAVASHRPAGAGKPEGAGKPDDPGAPADPGPPDGARKPEGVPPSH